MHKVHKQTWWIVTTNLLLSFYNINLLSLIFFFPFLIFQFFYGTYIFIYFLIQYFIIKSSLIFFCFLLIFCYSFLNSYTKAMRDSTTSFCLNFWQLLYKIPMKKSNILITIYNYLYIYLYFLH